MGCGCGRKKNVRATSKQSYHIKSSQRMKRHTAKLKSMRAAKKS